MNFQHSTAGNAGRPAGLTAAYYFSVRTLAFRAAAAFLLGTTLHAQNCPAPPGLPAVTPGTTMSANDYGRRGNAFQGMGNMECAAKAYQQGLALNPDSAPLQYSLAISLYTQGKRQPAVAALERSIALDPGLAQPHLALGVIDHDMGLTAKAMQQWQLALKADPTLPLALDWLAKARIEAGQYTAAADLLRTAPVTEDLTLDLVAAETRSGQADDAIARAQERIVAHPDWVRLPAALATVFVQRNRYEEALAVLRAAAAKHPHDEATSLLYLKVLTLTGDTATATPLAQTLLKAKPNDFDALYLSGLLEKQQGRYDEARTHLQAAVALDPKHYDSRYSLGFVLNKLLLPADAQAQLQQAIAFSPQVPEAHFQLAASLRSLKQPEGAQAELAIYHRLTMDKAKKDRASSLASEATQKLAAGDAATAVVQYREAIEQQPEDAVTYLQLAVALDRTGDLAGEQAALEQAVAHRPHFAAAQNQLGYLHARAGRNDAAERYFREALASVPQFAEAENNLGSLLAGEGKNAEAEKHFRDAIDVNPRYLDAWINLAATLADESRFSEAREAASTALRIDPGSSDAAQLLRSLPAQSAGAR